MSSSGSPDPLPEEAINPVDVENEGRKVPLLLIVLGVVALLLAVVIGSQVLGVLYVIVFPPAPPLPANLNLVSHVNSDYGVDAWIYTTTQRSCEVVQFYVEQGGVCNIAPICEDETSGEDIQPNVENVSQNVARCVGESKASIFALRWQAIIATGRTPDVATEFRVEREVFWTGAVPPMIQPSLE